LSEAAKDGWLWERWRLAGKLDQSVVSVVGGTPALPGRVALAGQNELGYERGLGIFPRASR